MSYLPNIITTLRIAGIPFFILLVSQQNFQDALYLMVGLGITDMLDGFLAKRFQWQSRFGAMLDPFADKLLLVSAFWMLYVSGLLKFWVVAVIFGRDIFVIAEYLLLRYRAPSIEFRPHWLGKLSTFLQFVLILSVLAASIDRFPAEWLSPLANLTVLIAVSSAVVYLIYGRNLWYSAVAKKVTEAARRRSRGSQYT